MTVLATRDREVFKIIEREAARQQGVLELIASENFTSTAVQEAAGSCLTNKYAEGYPGRRYYGGCEVVDDVENLARERLCQLFDAEYANVQPHSGSQANQAVYFTLLKPGDTVMGMDLAHGGHLTHGSHVNLSGKYFNFVHYGVEKETELIDYDRVAEIARECKPKLIVAGASAYPRAIDFAKFREIADEVGCPLMVDMAHIAGLCATGLHQNPVKHAQYVTSTTHKTLRGPRGGFVLTESELGRALDKALFPGLQGGPLMHIVAAKAVAFGECLQPSFTEYQHNVLANASELASALVDCGFRLVSGGTDNHLLLVDLTTKDITGRDAENLLERVGITTNKNAIPYDTRGPNTASGIRIGTPALTSRGMGSAEMKRIAQLMADAIDARDDDDKLAQLKEKATELAKSFPWPQA